MVLSIEPYQVGAQQEVHAAAALEREPKPGAAPAHPLLPTPGADAKQSGGPNGLGCLLLVHEKTGLDGADTRDKESEKDLSPCRRGGDLRSSTRQYVLLTQWTTQHSSEAAVVGRDQSGRDTPRGVFIFFILSTDRPLAAPCLHLKQL